MALGLISNPQLLYGAYNKALFLNGAFKFQPLVSSGSANTFFIGLGTVTGGSDTAGYDLTSPGGVFTAGTMTEFTAVTNPGYASYPLGAATSAGAPQPLTLNRQSSSVSGLYTTWSATETAFTATFMNTNAAGAASWNLAGAYVFIKNNSTPASILCYAQVGQAGDVLGPGSSISFQFAVESPTGAILLLN